MNKKIKIFLNAPLDIPNAQSMNCLAIAKYLNKNHFEVYALYTKEAPSIDNVNFYKVFFPRRYSKYLGVLWGVINCDIAYLPRLDCAKFTLMLLKLLNRISFRTMESIFDPYTIYSMSKSVGNASIIIDQYNEGENVYSITKYMKNYNFDKLNINSNDKILHLGVDLPKVTKRNNVLTSLNSVLLIGNDLIRKGIYDYLYLALNNPDIKFHIIGSGNGKVNMAELILKKGLPNVIYHGLLSNDDAVCIMGKVDINILPSKSEGFPKVILEAAAQGVPSILYDDYGANEWVTHSENAFLCQSRDDMEHCLSELKQDPMKISRMEPALIALTQKFSWEVVIKEWESEILKMTNLT